MYLDSWACFLKSIITNKASTLSILYFMRSKHLQIQARCTVLSLLQPLLSVISSLGVILWASTSIGERTLVVSKVDLFPDVY